MKLGQPNFKLLVLMVLFIGKITTAQIIYEGRYGSNVKVGEIIHCEYKEYNSRDCEEILIASISYFPTDNERLYVLKYRREINNGYFTNSKVVYEEVEFYATENEFESFADKLYEFCSYRQYRIGGEPADIEYMYFTLGDENLEISRREYVPSGSFNIDVEITFTFKKSEDEKNNTRIKGFIARPNQIKKLLGK